MEKVSYQIDVNTSRLKSALNDAENRLGKFGKKAQTTGSKLESGFKGIGVAAAGMFAADVIMQGITAIASLPAEIAQANKEMSIFAKQMGVSTHEAKGLDFAMQTVGLSGEKFADISKDIKDRIGEFATVGTGTFQDFGDVIGLTKKETQALAKEMQGLSGVESIQLVTDRMQAAGASTEQMTFVLESLGSDLSLASDLFKDNGKELTKLTSTYNSFNKELSETDTKALSSFDSSLKTAGAAIEGVKTQLAVALAPAFESVISTGLKMFKFFQKNIGGLKAVFAPLMTYFKPLQRSFDNLFSKFSEGAGIANTIKGALNKVGFALQFMAPMFESALEPVAALFDLFVEYGAGIAGVWKSAFDFITSFPIVLKAVKGFAAAFVGIFVAIRTTISETFKGLGGIIKGVFSGDLKQVSKGLMQFGLAKSTGIKKGFDASIASFNTEEKDLFADSGTSTKAATKKAALSGGGGNGFFKPEAKTKLTAKESSKVSGQRPQSITLNIDKVIETFTVNSSVKESAADAKKLVATVLLTAINDVNLVQ